MKNDDWSWLEVSKLFIALLTPLAVFYLSFTTQNVVDERKAVSFRQEVVQALARDIYYRRVRSELLASSLRRHSVDPTEKSMSELIERKKAYDEAYVNWGTSIQSNLLGVRQLLAADAYSDLEDTIEARLVGKGFSPLDRCLTQAYDEAIRSKNPNTTLDMCQVSDILQFILDCAYAITDELFNVTDTSPDFRSRKAFTSGQIADRCNSPKTAGATWSHK